VAPSLSEAANALTKRDGPQTETDRKNVNEGTAKDGSTSKAKRKLAGTGHRAPVTSRRPAPLEAALPEKGRLP